jgi:hypothetical protein
LFSNRNSGVLKRSPPFSSKILPCSTLVVRA